MDIEEIEDNEDKTRYSSAAERLNIVCYDMTSDGLNCEWLSPYKRKVTGSKPVAGTSVYRVHRSVCTLKTLKTNQPAWRRGSAQGS